MSKQKLIVDKLAKFVHLAMKVVMVIPTFRKNSLSVILILNCFPVWDPFCKVFVIFFQQSICLQPRSSCMCHTFHNVFKIYLTYCKHTVKSFFLLAKDMYHVYTCIHVSINIFTWLVYCASCGSTVTVILIMTNNNKNNFSLRWLQI